MADLKRPERFLFILRRPNWRSWIARGAVVPAAYGLVQTLWLVPWVRTAGAPAPAGARLAALGLTAVLAALCAGYTGWLFAQSRGRVLWLRRGLWLHFVAQALVAGAALLILVAPFIGLGLESIGVLRRVLLVGLVWHLGLTLVESRLAPPKLEAEYARAARLVSHGPFARRHWIFGVGVGMVAAIAFALFFMPPLSWAVAAPCALVGLYVEEDVLGRAGQALPISCRAIMVEDQLTKFKEKNAEVGRLTIDVDETCRLVLEEAKNIIKAENGSIMLLENDGKSLAIKTAFGPESDPKLKLTVGEGIAGDVMRTGRAELVNNVSMDSRFVRGGANIRSLLCVPLRMKDGSFGVINMSNCSEVLFTIDDLKLLHSLAIYASVAIQSAMNFSSLKSATDEMLRHATMLDM